VREDKERLREEYGIHYFERHRYFGVVVELVEETNQYQTVDLETVHGSEVDIGKGREMVHGIHNHDAWVVQEKGLLIHIHCALAVLERAPEIRSHYA
jgi:hypothetical protein